MAKTTTTSVLWLLCLAILLLPSGVVTQIWDADHRFNNRLSESPLGKLCYMCNAPAVNRARYDDGSTRYFCEEHHPPKWMRPTSSGDHGQKSFNPWLCILILGVIYGVNGFRALVQWFSTAKFFRVSLLGAVIGFGMIIIAWFWFSNI